MTLQKQLLILGTRGIPAAHGGFETLAEQLSLYLSERGWDVSVYCQEDAQKDHTIREEMWRGVRRIVVPTRYSGSTSSLVFDWRCILNVLRRRGRVLVLGYNTAVFNFILCAKRRPFLINMDGVEWQRPKWSLPLRAWFWINEKIAAHLGTTLIADHPEIEARLRKRFPSAKTTMIAYGAQRLEDISAAPLQALGVAPGQYYIVVCRIEPDNSVLELVKSFSATQRPTKLLVVGRLDAENPYHQAIRQSASSSVIFPGPIYDSERLASARFHARAYCHGHRFGGTNPSLVEALGAGNAVIAYNNEFNRWTAGEGQFFFGNLAECQAIFDRLDIDDSALQLARQRSADRFDNDLRLDTILAQYETLLSRPEFNR